MFGPIHYVPMLKSKRGEFAALSYVAPECRELMTPLIDLTPLSGKMTPLAYAREKIRLMAECWGDVAFLDGLLVQPSAMMPAGATVLSAISHGLAHRGVGVIPVCGLRRSVAYMNDVRDAVRLHGRGLCIRLEDEDFGSPTLQAQIEAVLAYVGGVTPADVDVILDFRAIQDSAARATALAAAGVIAGLPHLADWRTLTFAATAFPFDLSPFGRAPFTARVMRAEWAAWDRLAGMPIARVPSFGDCGISHSDFREFDGPVTIPLAVRYTTAGYFLVRKEGSARRLPATAPRDLARWLEAHPDFYGRGFSWGDGEIGRLADGTATNKGGAETWRKVGTSHHLRLVCELLSQMRAASNAPAPAP